MKKYARKARALMAVALMLAAAVAGCSAPTAGGQSGSASQAPATPPASSTSAQTESPAPEDSALQPGVNLPASETPIVLTDWVEMDPKISATLTAFSEMEAYQVLAERTNVTFEFIHPPVGEAVQAFNLMMASGDYPDIIERNLNDTYPGGPGRAIADGIIIPINDLVDQYAPNFKAFREDPANDIYRRQNTTDDGDIYGFSEAYTPVSGEQNIGALVWGFQMRKDWLDALGKEVPATIEEWRDVLAAFKQAYPEAAPFTARKELREYGLNNLMSAYGIPFNWYVENGATVKYGPEQPEYKEFLEEMAEWYAEGLIDPDFALNDSTAVDAKVLSNQAGSYIGLLFGAMGKYLQTTADPAFDLVGVPFPKDKSGHDYNYLLKSQAYITVMISSNNKHPAETVRAMDYLFTEEGRLLMTYGIEGETYSMVDGKPVFTELILNNPEGWSVDNAIAHFCRGSAASTMFVNDPLVYEQRMLYDRQREAVKVWGQADVSRTMPPVSPTAEEVQILADIMNPIRTYAEEAFVQFIMGQRPISEFDAYVESLHGMGIDDAIKIQQSALERYNQRD
jgi:putative aldouronate transport system substrate-binding protein